MEEKDILALLEANNWRSNKFKSCSVKNLCTIMEYLEKKLKTINGNWSSCKYYIFIHNKSLDKYGVERSLKAFYQQYSKRKKRVANFETYIKNFKISSNKKYTNWESKYIKPPKLQLKNKSDIGEFLRAIKLTKKEYLKGTDNDLIKILNEHFDTGYAESTLRKYYYDN